MTKNPSWTGADALESALDTAEEVEIGPGAPSGILVPDANGRGWRPINEAEKRALSNSPEPAAPRFGQRLRVWYNSSSGRAMRLLPEIADAIDRDAEGDLVCHKAEVTNLRAKLEAAVERCWFGNVEGGAALWRDDFLAELAEIFGPAGMEPKPERDLDAVLSDYLEWGLRTFPANTPASSAAHLRKEVAELEKDPESAEELADIVAIAFHSAARQGHDLTAALDAKLAILKTRTWQEPDADGVVEHVREPALAPDVEAALVNGARMQSQNLRGLLERCLAALEIEVGDPCPPGMSPTTMRMRAADDLRKALGEPGKGGGSVLGGELGHERREAQADRYAGRDGRVDGVDR